MEEFDFTLKFVLPENDSDPNDYIDALFEAGCDDAALGLGRKGRIALTFAREATSAQAAIDSAISDVNKAIPGVKLSEVSPDLVSATDLAAMLNCTRQNVRKMLERDSAAPYPAYEGTSNLWHLDDMLDWLQPRNKYSLPPGLMEVAATARIFNAHQTIQKYKHPGFKQTNLPWEHLNPYSQFGALEAPSPSFLPI
ncbi:DNA-binding protein [filamentous cyanobacterium LEGE 11480]|uniref:DNA-binding protein n=1 Tax=Romeriopsis navalis LEGE 11480 TaxID=2777977 RepID=A0A928Z4I4_9CYAN|nr:DNA-binding protein [Romeriopsis navalis]MBE9031804.1 DNA-binding protein [Romeriopsis navalis LEGE 11480]